MASLYTKNGRPLTVSGSSVFGPNGNEIGRRCLQQLAYVDLWNRAGRRTAPAAHPPPRPTD